MTQINVYLNLDDYRLNTPDMADRTVVEHLVQGQSAPLFIGAIGERNVGGAFSQYAIYGEQGELILALGFQDGNPAAVGQNGVTIEALLAICTHRLKAIQFKGAFTCAENAQAIDYMQRALLALKGRTARRLNQGVDDEDISWRPSLEITREDVEGIPEVPVKFNQADEYKSLAQRLREYSRNPHHINPMSEAFHRLIDEAAAALSAVATEREGKVPSEQPAGIDAIVEPNGKVLNLTISGDKYSGQSTFTAALISLLQQIGVKGVTVNTLSDEFIYLFGHMDSGKLTMAEVGNTLNAPTIVISHAGAEEGGVQYKIDLKTGDMTMQTQGKLFDRS